MPQGPGIHNSDGLFRGLLERGLLTVEQVHEGPYPESRFRLTERGRAVLELSPEAARAVEKAAAFCRDRTAAELSAITHERSRAWRQAQDGDILEIDIDLIPDDEYEARKRKLASLEEQLDKVLGGVQA
jgi:hypothetical protein